jgi:tape measure domain-containing protein
MADGASIANAYVTLRVKMPGVQGDIERTLGAADVDGIGRKLGGRVTKGMSAGMAAAAGAVAGAVSAVTNRAMDAMGNLAREAIVASDATEKFANTLKFAGLDDKAIKALGKSTRKYADQTVYDLGDIQNMTAQLASNSVKDFDKVAVATGNLNAIAGGNAETFKRVGMAVTQTAGAGKLVTENWNQITDAIPGASGKLQQAMLEAGAYTGNFREAMAKSEISAEEFNQAILALGFDQVAIDAAKSTTTIEGSMGNLQATIVGGFSDAITANKPAITGFINGAAQNISDAIPKIQAFAGAVQDFVGGIVNAFQSGEVTDSGFAGQLQNMAILARGLVNFFVGKVVPMLVSVGGWLGRNADWLVAIGVAVGGAVLAFKAWTAAVRIAQAVQVAFNVVLSANPIGIIVMAIAALVAGLVYFFTQTETGKKIWENFTRFLGETWTNIQLGFDVLVAWFKAAWDTLAKALQDGYNAFIKPVFDAFGAAAKWLSDTFKIVVAWIMMQWLKLRIAFMIAYYVYIKPMFDALGAAFNWLWTNVILKVGDWIRNKALQIGQSFVNMYNNYVKPAWQWIKDAISNGWEFIKGIIEKLVKFVKTEPKKAFEAARDGIGKAWEGIQELAKKPVRFVIETVINGLINTVNGILPKGMKIPNVPLPPGFSDGGYTGNVGRTQVAGVVHGNEHVIKASSRQKLERSHPGVLDHMNRTGSIPGYRSGGLVDPLPAGSFSVSQPYHGGHNGIDLAAASGTKVFAAGDGVVQLAGSVPMGGNEVYVQHANGLGTRYSHLSRFASSPGTPVQAGHVIGYVGSTGMSSGPHLHYMVHQPGGGPNAYGNHVNPAGFMGLSGADKGEAGGSASILGGLVDWAASKVKGAFPDGGMFVDVAFAMAQNAADSFAKAFNPFTASDDKGHTALYDNGGWLQPGMSLVENRTGRPEPILTSGQWETMNSLAANGGGGGVTINGDVVGFDPEMLAEEIERKQRRRNALAGIGGIR